MRGTCARISLSMPKAVWSACSPMPRRWVPRRFSFEPNELVDHRSDHRFDDPIRRLVAIDKGLDVDDNLFPHVYAPFDGRGAHMRQEDDVVQFDQLGIDRGLMLEDIEPGAGDL